jgi:transcriptional activator of cad operon
VLRIGDWDVNPTVGQISRDGTVVRLEARTMRLLLYLADRAGEVVSIDELLKEVWSGVIVTSDSVYQAVASLRRDLGDDPKQPTYIATVPRRGYRMVAPVTERVTDPPRPGVSPPVTRPWHRRAVFAIAGAVLALGIGSSIVYLAPPRDKSIAVMSFVDLTAGMTHEYWADGVTEEVIDKLSKVPGLRIVHPAASLKQIHVSYVLDGSVRQSGAMLRVAARLSRRDNGSVVWSETYDRDTGDIIMVEDDIAHQVAKALENRLTL